MTQAVELTRTDEPQQVNSLIQLAIDKGVDVELLERLVALQERVTERNARGAYFDALAKFQDECPQIKKTKRARITTRGGGAFEYSYAPLEQIAEDIRPHLKANGFSYTWNVTAENGSLVVGCTLRHVEGHSEFSTFPVPIDKSNPATSDAQKNGAALTYGKRQSLIMVAGLTTADEDIDGAKLEMKSTEFLSPEQLANLSDLIEAKNANLGKFLKWLGVPVLAEIPASEYKRAVDALNGIGV